MYCSDRFILSLSDRFHLYIPPITIDAVHPFVPFPYTQNIIKYNIGATEALSPACLSQMTNVHVNS